MEQMREIGWQIITKTLERAQKERCFWMVTKGACSSCQLQLVTESYTETLAPQYRRANGT
jgi:hypothetical protein